MSESSDLQEHLEHAEHVAHAAREGGLSAAAIPLSITAMAVIAAIFGSLETTAASKAVFARSDAAVRQGEASDLWGFFQARSIKKNMYEIAALQAVAGTAPDLKSKAEQYAAEEADLQAKAKAKEDEVRQQEVISETAMERHHHLTIATNIVHLAIALASVSMMMRRRWLWYGALATVVVGCVVGVI